MLKKVNARLNNFGKKATAAPKGGGFSGFQFVLIGSVLLFVLKTIWETSKSVSKAVNDAVTGASSEEEILNPQSTAADGSHLSYDSSVYGGFVKRISSAFEGGGLKIGGTDEEALLEVLHELKNGADFLKVYNLFGYRTYNGSNEASGIAFLDNIFHGKLDLIGFFKAELNEWWGKDKEVANRVRELAQMAGLPY